MGALKIVLLSLKNTFTFRYAIKKFWDKRNFTFLRVLLITGRKTLSKVIKTFLLSKGSWILNFCVTTCVSWNYILTLFLSNETSSSPLVYLTIVVRDQQKLIVCIIYDVCLCLGDAAVLHKSFYVTYIFLLPCHNDVGWEHPKEWVVETQRGFLELAKRVLPPSPLPLFLCYAATSKVWITSRQLESFSNSIAFATQDFRYILLETWLRFFGQSFPAP